MQSRGAGMLSAARVVVLCLALLACLVTVANAGGGGGGQGHQAATTIRRLGGRLKALPLVMLGEEGEEDPEAGSSGGEGALFAANLWTPSSGAPLPSSMPTLWGASACVAGETWSFTGSAPCLNCTECDAGSGDSVEAACTPTSNTVCASALECPAGQNFSSTGFEPCFPCTVCGSRRYERRCSPTRDARCRAGYKEPPDLGATAAYVAVGVSLVMLVATYLCVSHFYFRRMRAMRQQGRLQTEAAAGTTTATHDSAFKQQRLKVWRPRMRPGLALRWFWGAGGVLLPLGIVFLVLDAQVVEFTYRYDRECAFGDAACEVWIPIPQTMEAPVFMYYGLSEFYQNHRVYVKSRDAKQLRSDHRAVERDYKVCEPLARYGDYAGDKSAPGFNASLADHYLYPCGLVAQSFFTDRFEGACVVGSDGAPCPSGGGGGGGAAWDAYRRSGIAWPSDLDKFDDRGFRGAGLETRMNPRGFEMPALDDEDFVVWMRTAAVSWWWKLYARIESDLRSGDYLHLTIDNNYPAHEWGSTKELRFSTAGAFGTANPFMGGLFVAVGCLCLLLGAAVWYKVYRDPSYEPIPEGYMMLN